MKSIIKDALEYYKLGWCLIPISHKTKNKPCVKWTKYQQTRPTEGQIRRWFSSNSRNIAVVLGKVSEGLTCRDFDTMGEYEKWAAEYPDLAQLLPTVKTGKGRHVYFQADIEGIKHIANGELRGKGGYCLLPPSIHPEGANYEWLIPPNEQNLIYLDDIEKAGFILNVTEHTEHTEQTEAMVECVVVERAIRATLPQKFGTRNRKIFDFAKFLRTKYPNADSKIFRNAVRTWYNLALPNIRTKDFAETWLDFLNAWDNIKYFEGVNPMVIYEQAIKLEPPPTVALNYHDNPKIQNLAVLCREMQKACDNNPFFLSARTAAGLLGISAMQANRYLRLLVKEDILKIIEKGGTAEKPRKATRFRYIASQQRS